MPKGSPSERASGEGSRKAPKKRITDEEWLMHKETIGRLYLDEGKDVRHVRELMMMEYGFEAHEKAYKRKFEEWGLTKNVPKEEGLFMVRKREQRRGEGKDTLFWRRRRTEGPLQLVPDDKVDRIADRYAHDLHTYDGSEASTPENIEYGTPEDTTSANTVPAVKQEEQSPTTGAPWGYTQPQVDQTIQQQPEEYNVMTQPNPNVMNWDPWTQQYY